MIQSNLKFRPARSPLPEEIKVSRRDELSPARG